VRRAIPHAAEPEPPEPAPSFRDQLLVALEDPDVADALLAIVRADVKASARPLRAAR
jgi:hypothetical protein